ncbi:MAG: hypothetical protein IJC04_09390 [Oscillospiraceae bacterium]|nr:hypothetical protein [Oscillospiraceae bacterium]
MKKIIKIAMAALTVCIAAVVMAVTVFAEMKDVELSVTRATMCAAWGQSVTYTASDFKIADFTENTEVIIEYETEGGAMPDNGYNPAELIFQNYSSDPQIWCQITPYEYNETSAKFAYSDMIAAYVDLGGKEDLSDVNNVCIGATFVGVKVTKVTVTNVEAAEAVTTTTTAATEAVTEATTEAATEAETTAATTSAPSAEKESSGGIPIVLIVVIAVVVAVAVVVTIIVLKSKKRFY